MVRQPEKHQFWGHVVRGQEPVCPRSSAGELPARLLVPLPFRLPLGVEPHARLPEKQRALIWLREVEGQSYAELAEILEIPVGTVRSRLFAAREELRRVWQAAPEAKKGET